jgi:hypothetical protein
MLSPPLSPPPPAPHADIVPGEKGAVATFSFDPARHAPVDLADMLWAAVGKAHAATAATGGAAPTAGNAPLRVPGRG